MYKVISYRIFKSALKDYIKNNGSFNINKIEKNKDIVVNLILKNTSIEVNDITELIKVEFYDINKQPIYNIKKLINKLKCY